MKTAIIIPARFASTRLPGKPLIKVKGKPIIQWVYEKSKQSKLATSVIVATDDERIFEAVRGFGGEAVMTADTHQSGSDRIAEVVRNNPEIEIAVNVQGDEPLIDPVSIDKAINELENADISTLIREITDKDEIPNPNLVKVVTDNNGKALYFSRSPIPYEREAGHAKFYAHIGLYVYRRDALLKITALKQSDLEKAECLEQLRALQNGFVINTVIVDYKPVGIDTPEDVKTFEKSVI
ncbi:MAG: 3-deoxy-manno-octulosonate cytidylyltransferase [Candidatus Melainabacteria bacterium GWF2_37_15]|nr:MAG: 3-deoxy-manno-octulosonate cytidylyltransferase [Candidatus Melainabacteria bacterium GWF2_37_15]